MYELISHLRAFRRKYEEFGVGLRGVWSSWEEQEGGQRRLEEANVEGRRRSQGINIKVKGPSPILLSNVTTPPPITKPYQRRRVGGRDWRSFEDVRGRMRRCWRREEVQESQGPRVPRSRGPKVPETQRTKISQTQTQIRA